MAADNFQVPTIALGLLEAHCRGILTGLCKASPTLQSSLHAHTDLGEDGGAITREGIREYPLYRLYFLELIRY